MGAVAFLKKEKGQGQTLSSLSPDAKLKIVGNPNIPVGAEVILLCKAGGDGDIRWFKDGKEIVDEEKVVQIDEGSSSLKITSASMQDAGNYTCHCEFDSGNDDEITTELFIYEGPSFGNTATYHEFLEGTVGIVPCLVTGAPAVDAIWFRDKQEITTAEGRRVRQQDNTLRFEMVTRNDAGTYVCKAKIRGRPINKELAVSVVVNVPPTVHLREKEKKVLAGPYTNVSIEGFVEGHPTPNITWTTPTSSDPSRHHFNSDRSQLLISSVGRADYGEYVCTVTNKIGKSNATIMLHVFEAPEVFVSHEQLSVSLGKRVSVFCNVSGHPQPELHWLNKHNGRTLVRDRHSGHIHVAGGEMVIEEVMPSDGGLYSCMAVSVSGNASRDVAIHTHADMPRYVKIYPGPASALLSLKTLPINGGTEITNFVLQWRENTAEEWQETTVPVAGPLVISPLRQYTSYAVRLAGLNRVGVGLFSDTLSVRTLGMREPDIPNLSLKQLELDKNTISVPLQQSDDGGMPIQHFNIRFQKDKDGAEWKEMQLSPDSDSISLQDLSFGSDYQVEVTAVNANGSSLPSRFNFTIGEQPVSSGMTNGGVVAIVTVLFLLVLLAVDASCCYRNQRGLLMYIAVKLFGQRVPEQLMLRSVETHTSGCTT
ncbi:neural cell adhesion molecule 1-like [Nelusetta ayraudi]|uniref:neural cell adhesion molecule 1-like n=1 Tax=Nelusetta ayraudi TaxID=303726 RepID=UPI003F705E6E